MTRRRQPTTTEKRDARSAAAAFFWDELETRLWDKVTEDPEDLLARIRHQLVQDIGKHGPVMAFFEEVKEGARKALVDFTTISPADVGSVSQAQYALRQYFEFYAWLDAHLPGSADGVGGIGDEIGDEGSSD